jgi:hypothetical protein
MALKSQQKLRALQNSAARPVIVSTDLNQNLGRKLLPIEGINGGAANNPATWTAPAAKRFHRLMFNFVAVNYTGTGTLATKKITGAGADNCTVSLTIVKGQVTAAAVVAAGTGYVTGDTIQPTDPTGQGCVLTVTAGGGAVTGLAVANGGTASPIDPVKFLKPGAAVEVKVNSNIREIYPENIQRILNVRGIYPALGALLIPFSEIDRNFLTVNDRTSFDLTAVGVQMKITMQVGDVVSPGITGVMEVDGYPTLGRDANNNKIRVVDPIRWKQTTLTLKAGENTFNETNLPAVDEPIQRIYLLGLTTAGQLTKVYVEADEDAKVNIPVSDLNRSYEPYGFDFGRPNDLNRNYATSNTLKAAFNPPSYFDTAFLSDVDSRLGDRLFYSKFVIRITSAIAQDCLLVMETAPGKY